MPELPEVEAARSAISDHCSGKKIIKAIIANDSKVIDGVSPSDFEASLLNKTIVAAHRKGKNLWLQLDSPPFPSFQFGMTGAVYIKGVAVTKYKRSAVNDADEWPSKFSKFFIELDDGLEVSFTDKRRFAKVRLLNDPASVAPISELGPDALLEPMTEEQFFKSLSKKKIAIKTLLLDQSFISGIGNWIADEVLYQARIHPLQNASSVSREESSRLQKCIKEVVRLAVEVDADSQQFPFNWLFHFRWGKKPGEVDGKKIDFISVGGRTTAYVPELQKLSGAQATRAPAKPRKQASRKKKNDDSDDDSDESENEEGNAKSKQVKKSNGGKKPPKRNKTAKSGGDDDEEEDDHENDDDEKTTKGRGIKAPAKRKPQGRGNDKDVSNKKSSDNDSGDGGDETRCSKAEPVKPALKRQKRAK